MAIYDRCWTGSAEDQCSSKCEIECTVMNNDTKVKYNVAVPHNTLERSCACLAWGKVTFVKLLLKGTYTLLK